MDQLKSHLWFAIWVSLIIVVVVPWGTLQSDPRWERMEWIPFVSPPVEFLDMVGNVLFYIPFGILCGFEVADARKPVALVTGCAALLSISTELSQVFSVNVPLDDRRRVQRARSDYRSSFGNQAHTTARNDRSSGRIPIAGST